MAKSVTLLVCLVFLCNAGHPSWAQTCTSSFGSNRLFSSCQTLQQLDANFAWTYEPGNGSIRMAFTARPDTPKGWVAWGINPVAPAMGGTRSLIAFRHSNGSLLVLTYNVTDANKGGPLEPSPIDFEVVDMAAEFKNNQITLFATWTLKNGQTTVNHVWNTGEGVTDLVPGAHAFAPANLASKGTIDLKTGAATTSTSSPNHVLKNVSALLLRPKKDHKIRMYWNIYHHGLGYTAVVLSIVNIFKGFDILKPDDKWKQAFIIVIAILGGIAVVLEAASWITFLVRRLSRRKGHGV